MNKGPVIVKGCKDGMTIIVDEDISFETVKDEIITRFLKSNHKNTIHNPISITFEGKEFTTNEKNELISILENAGLVINKTKDIKTSYYTEIPNDKDGLFYIGNIRNGQILEAKESIVLIGNIFPGGVVTSSGNIVVIGNVWGKIYPGNDGKEDAFYYISGGIL